ncbi:MAG: DNA translocase FtsK, partial [Bacteroidales bacterium]|nr:DNA translocase FtsK [Bacteroidales bacterium]
GGMVINNTNAAVENTDNIAMEMKDYDPKEDLSRFKQPGVDLLKIYDNDLKQVDVDEDEVLANKNLIERTLQDFGIEIERISSTVGPTITLYEIVSKAGTRISKIQSLEKDIMMNLEALGIRIIAPIPGKGTVGIEVPNKKRQTVSMYSVINSKEFKESTMELPVALGKTITNEVYMFDLAKMPHLLVAGATGQGKSVGLNAIVTSLLYKKHPSQLKFVLVDPKMVEFSIYAGLEKHYMAQYPGEDDIIITDCLKVQQTLNSLVQEMENRYKLLMEAHCRNIIEYNDKFIHRQLNPNKGHKYLAYIVIIIDEFGDFIMQAGKEIETPIARIAQKARAVGMHLILATQRPSVKVITGLIKANIPGRIAFRTASGIDSSTILDERGAEGLTGKGDLLISTGQKPERVQCAFVDTPEVEKIVAFIQKQAGYGQPMQLPEVKDSSQNAVGSSNSVKASDELDPIFEDAAHLIVSGNSGSTSLIQRNFSLGYNRAGRVMDQMEAHHIVGPAQGSKPREVLVDTIGLEQILNNLREKGMLK